MSMKQSVVEMGNAYKDVVGKSELMRPSRSSMQGWKENAECEVVVGIRFATERDKY
jgi:hypothetical protein